MDFCSIYKNSCSVKNEYLFDKKWSFAWYEKDFCSVILSLIAQYILSMQGKWLRKNYFLSFSNCCSIHLLYSLPKYLKKMLLFNLVLNIIHVQLQKLQKHKMSHKSLQYYPKMLPSIIMDKN